MSARVVLRAVREADLPAIFEQQRDPESVEMAGVPGRDREAFDAHWERLLADPSVVKQAILLDGEVVGHALSFVEGERRYVGYWIAREHWGRGIASAAFPAFLALLGERPLHASASAGNKASLRVLEKSGFTVVSRDDDGVLLVL